MVRYCAKFQPGGPNRKPHTKTNKDSVGKTSYWTILAFSAPVETVICVKMQKQLNLSHPGNCSKTMFQESTRIANILAIVSPIVFIVVPFLQFWIFHLYHKYGHPWSHIIFPDRDMDAQNLKVEETESESEARAPSVVDSVQCSILTLDSV